MEGGERAVLVRRQATAKGLVELLRVSQIVFGCLERTLRVFVVLLEVVEFLFFCLDQVFALFPIGTRNRL